MKVNSQTMVFLTNIISTVGQQKINLSFGSVTIKQKYVSIQIQFILIISCHSSSIIILISSFFPLKAINIWCGILNDRLIAPHFYKENLISQRYLQFLLEKLPQLMQNIPNNTKMYYQQEGCQAHNS